jgi:phage shock protein PspC (stress-responsive transcriptional regulator)
MELNKLLNKKNIATFVAAVILPGGFIMLAAYIVSSKILRKKEKSQEKT